MSEHLSLFHHTPHPHRAVNVNAIHDAEKAAAGLNQRIAITLTRAVGTMECAYFFAVLAIIGFPGFQATVAQWVQWVSQTFIQLVMLSVIMVGQSVLGRKQELQANEAYATTLKTFSDIEQIMAHLNAQDVKILEIHDMLRRQETGQMPAIHPGDMPHD